MQVKLPVGIFKLTLFKLFPVAPLISTNLPFFANRRVVGISIFFLLDKYCPVILFLSFLISSYDPCIFEIKFPEVDIKGRVTTL